MYYTKKYLKQKNLKSQQQLFRQKTAPQVGKTLFKESLLRTILL